MKTPDPERSDYVRLTEQRADLDRAFDAEHERLIATREPKDEALDRLAKRNTRRRRVLSIVLPAAFVLMVITVGIALSETRRNDLERQDKERYVANCHTLNSGRLDLAAARDATADIVEVAIGLVPANELPPEQRAELARSLRRLREEVGLQDCSWPPFDPRAQPDPTFVRPNEP